MIFWDPCCPGLPSVSDTGSSAASPSCQPSSAEGLDWCSGGRTRLTKWVCHRISHFFLAHLWTSLWLLAFMPPWWWTSHMAHKEAFPLILAKACICFSKEATIETWTFREWEGNLLKTKEDCRCKMFVMLTPEQTYHCALAYLLPTHCLYWVQCLANCRHINQAFRLEQSHCFCAALSRPYKCVII